ncbi:MAG: polymer-forming cytoskeletal protein [Deltaproteobacteria bacterium]|nr:polymer-forming cytoskeletal protein [Deltaproteobacteria bacterium]
MAGEAGSVISKGITIKGNIEGTEDIVVEGAVEGGVVLDSTLTVSPSGNVKADVSVHTLTVEGAVEGNVEVEDCVLLRANSSFKGNIKAPRVIVESGAMVNGGLDMDIEVSEG